MSNNIKRSSPSMNSARVTAESFGDMPQTVKETGSNSAGKMENWTVTEKDGAMSIDIEVKRLRASASGKSDLYATGFAKVNGFRINLNLYRAYEATFRPLIEKNTKTEVDGLTRIRVTVRPSKLSQSSTGKSDLYATANGCITLGSRGIFGLSLTVSKSIGV